MLVALSSRFRPIRDAIFYRLSGVHQLFMAAHRRALKKCADRPATFIERHNDVGWPIRALVRIRDGVSTLIKGAKMTFERFAGAFETFFKGKPRGVFNATGKNRNMEEHA